jgi:hypothetical protein
MRMPVKTTKPPLSRRYKAGFTNTDADELSHSYSNCLHENSRGNPLATRSTKCVLSRNASGIGFLPAGGDATAHRVCDALS